MEIVIHQHMKLQQQLISIHNIESLNQIYLKIFYHTFKRHISAIKNKTATNNSNQNSNDFKISLNMVIINIKEIMIPIILLHKIWNNFSPIL